MRIARRASSGKRLDVGCRPNVIGLGKKVRRAVEGGNKRGEKRDGFFRQVRGARREEPEEDEKQAQKRVELVVAQLSWACGFGTHWFGLVGLMIGITDHRIFNGTNASFTTGWSGGSIDVRKGSITYPDVNRV